MTAPWPVPSERLDFAAEETAFGAVIEAIRAIRARRAEMNVPPSRKAKLFIETEEAGVFAQGVPFLQRLASASEVEIGNGFAIEGAVQVITDTARILIPMEQLVDKEKEKARLEKERAEAQREVDFLLGKLANEGFVSRAPAAVVEAEREKLRKAQDRRGKIAESLATI
jgi:valyl-tRNA synthetase